MIDTTIVVNVRDLFLSNVSDVELSSAGNRVKASVELTSIKSKAQLRVETFYDPPTPISKGECEASVQKRVLEAWNGMMTGDEECGITANFTWDQISDWAIAQVSKPSTFHILNI